MAEFEFDVFLSHNSNDKQLVRELKKFLELASLKAWLDEDELRPGINWQPLLEEGVRASQSIAVLIGPDGLGPWEDEEMQAALQLAVKDRRPIIPTLLPGCPKKPELPMFLGIRTWVDLRNGYTGAVMDRLIWGITGEKPDSLSTGDETTPEMVATPAELWTESATGTNDCYHQLSKICDRGEVPKGEARKALWNAVKRHRPTSFRDWQLANLARWSAHEYLEVEERFTPLQVNVRVRESAEASAEKQQLPFDTLAEAMDAVFDEHLAPASVIFAPPGGGKSTLLRHHQLNQAQYLADGERLVFYVQLRDYRPDKISKHVDPDIGNPAMAWLEAEWRKETAAAPPLFAFIRQGSLTLLLDGLNEIPRRNDDEYRTRVAEWRELIDEVDHSYPGVRLLFACRPLDYSQRLDAGRHTRLPEIEVQALEPERIKAFIDRRFDTAIAAQVWEQLESHPSLELYSSPYYLNLLLGQIDTQATEISIPQNRAALFSGMVRERLRRELNKTIRFDAVELLGKRDSLTILNDKARGNWLPDETEFFPALAALAFHIQDASGSNERWGTLRWNRAGKAMNAELKLELPADDYLEAACDLGLFEDDAAQSGDIRFIHQQMQEYFAAWVLAKQVDLQQLSVPWRSVELAEASTEALLAKGCDDDLPELPSTGWEETALIAAILSERPDDFIRVLLRVNLALAGRCAAQEGLSISDSLRHELQSALLERSQDLEADLRVRIAAGKALGELGDPRLQAPTVKSGNQVLLPAFVFIAGGEYTIGGDPEGFPDEKAPQKVTLKPFELALHPVTNAEYACFVAAGGYNEDAYWPGRALAWRNGKIGPGATSQRIREYRQFIMDNLGATTTVDKIQKFCKLSHANSKWWQERIRSNEKDFEDWLLQAYLSPVLPFTQPRYWRSLIWGNSTQPVVGVCWYEAQAYCHWLNAILDSDSYSLPSEAEWEAAGRGRGQWRRYAWYGDFDPQRVNSAETRLGVTTPIGVFPNGSTRDKGLLDMCGNVWEWTTTPRNESEIWNPTAGPNTSTINGLFVMRGGSWNCPQKITRLGTRGADPAEHYGKGLGFRVCRSSTI